MKEKEVVEYISIITHEERKPEFRINTPLELVALIQVANREQREIYVEGNHFNVINAGWAAALVEVKKYKLKKLRWWRTEPENRADRLYKIVPRWENNKDDDWIDMIMNYMSLDENGEIRYDYSRKKTKEKEND